MTGWPIASPKYFIGLANAFKSKKEQAHENALKAAQDGNRKLMKKYLGKENLYRLMTDEEPLSYSEKREILRLYQQNIK